MVTKNVGPKNCCPKKNVGPEEDFIPNTPLPAGICFGWENFWRHEGEAMGRQTDLVLDASLPKHKNVDDFE